MKKYIIAFFSTLLVLGILHLVIVGNSYFKQEKKECTKSLILYGTSTANAVNHLGQEVEVFCTQWSK